MRKQIPNLITLTNLLCGVFATMMAVQGRTHIAALFIAAGIFADFFDGLAARSLKVSSAIGKELDSLADLVTSGVAPGFILMSILDPHPLKWLALLIPLFSAYRLAKFNLDERQTTSFLGLPTPANALIWATLGILYQQPQWGTFGLVTISATTLPAIIWIILSLILDILLISEVPLFSLKVHNLRWGDNKTQYIFLIGTAIIIVLFGIFGIALAILWYILLSLITRHKHE